MSALEQIFADLGAWNWLVLGLVLLGLEILAPGTIFLWFGIAALVVGAVSLFVDLPWQVDVVVFLLLAFSSLLIGRKLMAKISRESGDPGLNQRGSRYVGREFVLATPISQGDGRLSIDDTVWRISGPDLPAGTRVTVDRVEGVKLVVKPLQPRG
ncbi:hypothetical protein JM93_03629 [Roseibium hamelinense]|uniref:NfeD-like C-terminal domain-containing protein n=1 Tax=Roseibium hamelinense TaxID=150831 RepID=A0A562SLS5_9HYPH|nr:NfeD family protein [Roseibium hamelinense]MTI45015.1 NfeD family protein [Roseibium hamelinense]TWI82279.1 hypothetical protein JM93_03629 [Roseibium hamelinense]